MWRNFSTWQIFSPQPAVVMVVTNIRYADEWGMWEICIILVQGGFVHFWWWNSYQFGLASSSLASSSFWWVGDVRDLYNSCTMGDKKEGVRESQNSLTGSSIGKGILSSFISWLILFYMTVMVLACLIKIILKNFGAKKMWKGPRNFFVALAHILYVIFAKKTRSRLVDASLGRAIYKVPPHIGGSHSALCHRQSAVMH